MYRGAPCLCLPRRHPSLVPRPRHRGDSYFCCAGLRCFGRSLGRKWRGSEVEGTRGRYGVLETFTFDVNSIRRGLYESTPRIPQKTRVFVPDRDGMVPLLVNILLPPVLIGTTEKVYKENLFFSLLERSVPVFNGSGGGKGSLWVWVEYTVYIMGFYGLFDPVECVTLLVRVEEVTGVGRKL